MRELRRWIRPLVAALLALAGEAQAARDLETDARWKEARQALDNGWFSVAALKGERLRQEQGWDEDDAKDIAGLVAEAWLRARQPDLLLKSLEREPRPHGTLYWRGEAHRMKGELEVAELVLLNYANAGRNEERARLALAQVYLAQGRDTMARRELRPLRDSADAELARRARLMFNESELALHRNEVVQGRLRDESVQDQEAHFLEARALLQEERAEEALEICRVILKGTDGGRRLHHAAQLLAVEALLQSDDAVQAEKELMLFLTTVDRTEFWGEAFDLLSRIRKAGRRPVWTEPPPELGLWVADNTHPERQGYAMFVLGDWLADQQRWQEAAALLESLVAAHPGHPAESAAIRRAMEAYGALGEDARVLELAERWRKDHGGGGEATVDFIAGTIFYQRGDATEAAERFQRSADLAGSVLERRRALYNAGAAALKAGQMALFGRLLAQLDVVGGAEAEGTAAAVAGAGSGETAG